MYRVFMHYKRDEWERYCAQVSDWDVTEYLDVLPLESEREMCGLQGSSTGTAPTRSGAT